MNIQIFGTSKCFDTKKAERYFKERGIKYQFVDLKKYGMSKGELNSVILALEGIHSIINKDTKEKDLLALLSYLSLEDQIEKLLEHQSIIKTPIVRNGKKATIGYQPEIWKQWEE